MIRDWVKEYDKHIPHWALSLQPSKLTSYFIDLLREKEIQGKILEVGCGNGRDSLFLASQGFDTIGIDISPGAIDLANQSLAKIDKLPAEFKVADAENLPFPDGYFSGVYSLAVLNNTNIQKSLREIVRVLKPGAIATLNLHEKTIFVESGKEELFYTSEEVKSVLAQLPINLLFYHDKIIRDTIDIEEGEESHKHVVIFLAFEKTKSAQNPLGIQLQS